MFSTPEFWVFVSFVLFIGLFGKRGVAFIRQLLNEHRQKITQQLEEAQRLHDEALSLLNSYKKKHAEAVEHAETMIAFAEKEAAGLKKTSEEEFKKLIAQKEKALLQRIALETAETKSKLKKQAADEAFAIVENLLSKDPKERKKLTSASLKEIASVELKTHKMRE